MDALVDWTVTHIGAWGYLGIFVLMFIESSLFPFPSEVVMIPAGINAAQGKMDVSLAILAGTLGSLAGAYFNYFLAAYLGRPFLEKYGKYFFLPPEKFKRACEFFERHGTFGTFSCRLLPGIRQVVSLPAGLARMEHWKFALSTSLGAGLWVAVLTVAGYWVGNHYDKAKAMVKSWTPAVIVGVLLMMAGYALWIKFTSKDSEAAKAVDSEPSQTPSPEH